ncbi:hypothetical protein AAH978_04130 [Streptomyces sp. ZYX-F-203]
MSDLHLDETVFHDLRGTFSRISDRMEDVRRSLRGTEASVAGEVRLIEEVREFSDEWSHGVRQLGKHTQEAVKMINMIEKAFDGLDFELAQTLRSRKTENR